MMDLNMFNAVPWLDLELGPALGIGSSLLLEKRGAPSRSLLALLLPDLPDAQLPAPLELMGQRSLLGVLVHKARHCNGRRSNFRNILAGA